MTTTQKVLVTATLVAAVSVAMYEAYRAHQLERNNRALRQEQAPLAKQIQQLEQERGETAREVAALREENERLTQNTAELLNLRGEVSDLKRQAAEASASKVPRPNQVSERTQHAAWKLREPRRIGEFENVGNETPEAAAETVLWAVFSYQTNLLEMVHLPPEFLAEAQDKGMTYILARQLASDLAETVRDLARDEAQQVWLDGGNITFHTWQGAGVTKTYAYVIDFHLSGREDLQDRATERHYDFLFAKIDGVWKLVIPWVSPEIPER